MEVKRICPYVDKSAEWGEDKGWWVEVVTAAASWRPGKPGCGRPRLTGVSQFPRLCRQVIWILRWHVSGDRVLLSACLSSLLTGPGRSLGVRLSELSRGEAGDDSWPSNRRSRLRLWCGEGTARVWGLTLPLSNLGTLGKLLNPFTPQSPHG